VDSGIYKLQAVCLEQVLQRYVGIDKYKMMINGELSDGSVETLIVDCIWVQSPMGSA
jgi:septum formation topological specificity factor MinE